ncbi:hypothetical protein [Brevundimonas sp. C43]|uniref:hypothetical protein n=1 Tax=Brevundimonas sp. C43 TaxID=3068314 RepID=UPI00273D6494|nr:hypothetical protein [Brevundimonas sp. C43]
MTQTLHDLEPDGPRPSAAELFRRSQFTGSELRNFRHLDPERTLAGDTGAALLSRMVALAEAHEVRQRALQPDAVKSRGLTASTLLANLASLALNRVDDTRFLAVPFNRNAYANTDLSLSAMSLLRDAMLANGLIEGSAGGQRIRPDDTSFGWLTRMRATPALRAIFADCRISYTSIRRTVGDVLILRDRKAGVPIEPPVDVEMTRQTLASMNKRIEAARIELPQDAWARVTPGTIDAMHLDDEDRAPAGDLAGKSLVRLFKYDWRQGGRLYGGWWMSLPKRERKLLTIDGEPVAELDYGQLHPSILYARIHEELDGDAYTVGDWTSPPMRELGKTTFARMLNTTTEDGEPRAIQMADGDADKLPPGVTWEDYLPTFQRKLAPISEWFWIGEGLRLQREDSDVAVSVLETMEEHGVTTLPVHDSFIVPKQHRPILRYAMTKAYREKFYYHPIIK